MQSSLKNMVIVLGTITLVASAAVGGIYLLTQEPIATSQTAKINGAIAQVVPAFDNRPAEEAVRLAVGGGDTTTAAAANPTLRETQADTITVYPATLNGEAVGYAVETFSNSGFGGRMSLMVGFLPDGTIQDISVISHNETPGLGDKIQKEKSNFIETRFVGKNPADPAFRLAVTKDGGSVDAITASTISSRAFTGAVKQAFEVWQAWLNDRPVEATSGATATAAGAKKHASTARKAKPQEAEEEDFEFDPSAVKGALPYDASTGATATATTDPDAANTQKGGE
jgi:electron transport complex protein RnfG